MKIFYLNKKMTEKSVTGSVNVIEKDIDDNLTTIIKLTTLYSFHRLNCFERYSFYAHISVKIHYFQFKQFK